VKVMAKILVYLIALFLTTSLLGGCAASGDGGAVHFDARNSQEIVLSPFYLSDPAAGADHAWYLTRAVADKTAQAGFLKPNQMLLESFSRAIFKLQLEPGKPLPATGGSSQAGCQGTQNLRLALAENGNFTGELVYDHYADDCTLVLNGRVPVRGQLDRQTGDLTARLEVLPLTATLTDKNLQLRGELSLELNAFAGEKQRMTLMADLSLSEGDRSRYALRQLALVWDGRGAFPQVTLTGSLAFTDHGLVRLTTESPLQINPQRGLPFDGVLRFQGRDDSWLRLWFAKPAMTGFFKIDGSDGLQTIGQL